jgi:hypothetical protein
VTIANPYRAPETGSLACQPESGRQLLWFSLACFLGGLAVLIYPVLGYVLAVYVGWPGITQSNQVEEIELWSRVISLSPWVSYPLVGAAVVLVIRGIWILNRSGSDGSRGAMSLDQNAVNLRTQTGPG